nr:hypothetical protein [Lachnospiraceae bacterium]
GEITTESEDSSNANSDVTVEEQVLFDQDGVSVKLKSLDTDGFWGAEFALEISNTTDRDVVVSNSWTTVNGVMTDPLFAETVAAGKTANATMDIFSSSLKAAGIETIQTVEAQFRVYDDETWEDLFVTDVITINTSAAGSFEQTYNDEGTELYNDGTYRIVAQKLDSEDSFWGADIYLYIENNGDQKVDISATDVSINGYMVDPAFSEMVMPQRKAFSSITFFESDLEDNGIESIDTMELKFHIYNDDTYDTIVETDPITVNFN